jgi:hypothetical protein
VVYPGPRLGALLELAHLSKTKCVRRCEDSGSFGSLAPPSRLKRCADKSKSRGQGWARRVPPTSLREALRAWFSPYRPITNHQSPITPSARAGDADPDNADANEPILRADGRVNAVHRADRSVHGHADDAHHANVDARE